MRGSGEDWGAERAGWSQGVLAHVQLGGLHSAVLPVLGDRNFEARNAVLLQHLQILQTFRNLLGGNHELLCQAPAVGVLEEVAVAVPLATRQIDLVNPLIMAALHLRVPRESLLPVPRRPFHGMTEGELVAQLLRGHYVRRHLVRGVGLCLLYFVSFWLWSGWIYVSEMCEVCGWPT